MLVLETPLWFKNAMEPLQQQVQRLELSVKAMLQYTQAFQKDLETLEKSFHTFHESAHVLLQSSLIKRS